MLGYIERRHAMLRNRLDKLRTIIADLAADPLREPARRAAEIEVIHLERELAELDPVEGVKGVNVAPILKSTARWRPSMRSLNRR